MERKMRQLRGFLPWITYPCAVALVDWRIAAAAALAAALAVAVVALVAGRASDSVDMFTIAAVVFFAGLFVVAVAAPGSGVNHYVGALTPAALAVAATISIAVHRPFTIPFAKRVAPREFWDTPIFMHINNVLTAVWATSFAVMASVTAVVLALHLPASSLLLMVQIAGFVIPMRICRSYPASVRASYAAM
jgi:hypothetical protein